jgi:hypothetical protein
MRSAPKRKREEEERTVRINFHPLYMTLTKAPARRDGRRNRAPPLTNHILQLIFIESDYSASQSQTTHTGFSEAATQNARQAFSLASHDTTESNRANPATFSPKKGRGVD